MSHPKSSSSSSSSTHRTRAPPTACNSASSSSSLLLTLVLLLLLLTVASSPPVSGFGQNCPAHAGQRSIDALSSFFPTRYHYAAAGVSSPADTPASTTTTDPSASRVRGRHTIRDRRRHAAAPPPFSEKRNKNRRKKGGGDPESEWSPPRNHPGEVRIAFLGDQGLGRNPTRVLDLVREWDADLLVQLGDFDYNDDPSGYVRLLESKMDASFPVLAVVGNHDLHEWDTPAVGYAARFTARLRSMPEAECAGDYGVNMVCVWKGMVFVLSGIGTLGTDHARVADEALARFPAAAFKFCVFHKNQKAFQTGDKQNETGYDLYEVCRRHGAVVITSHEHSYERTHLMADFERQVIASTDNTLHVRPGRSFVAVSGMGGQSIRYWKDGNQLNPWWAATAAMDVSVFFLGFAAFFRVS
ncbi:Metallo-dependent phosphatase-like protein [Zopfochytrium polystomum]|nr:Metallo-dependent phosphatase-like protein [Zopfochytrium polystomum]